MTDVQALLFDFGNVVGFFDHNRAWDRLAPHTTVPVATLHRLLMGGQLECDFDSGRISKAQFLAQVRDAGHFICPDEFLEAAIADIFWPNDAVIALLPRLKGRYRVLLGSNTNEIHSDHFCKLFADALGHFDELVLSHRIGTRKPDAAFFEHCVERAGCPAEQCLFIDDLPANVAGARACGLYGVVYTDPDDLRRQLAAHGVSV